METYEKYYGKKDDNKKKNISSLITKVLCSIIFMLSSIIFIKLSDNNKESYKHIFLEENISFTKINQLNEKYLGNVIPINTISDNTIPVFQEDTKELKKENYLNGVMIDLGENRNIPIINSGIIVYIGEKEGYQNTMIVQGNDGVDIWYGNVSTDGLNLYDYIKKDTFIKANDNHYYVVIMKDKEYLNYDEYVNN